MATATVRRNGQLPSCEPCRKSKVRCDHGKPQCARCMRRGLSAQQCYYHPAPMSAHTKATSPIKQAPPTPAYTQSPAVTTLSSVSVAASPALETFDRATGLVGMHNSLAEFSESEETYSQRSHAALTRTGVAPPSEPVSVSPALVAEGASILERLLDFDYCTEEWCRRFLSDSVGFWVQGPIITTVVQGMMRGLQQLRRDRSQAKLFETSRAIFEQTSKPLVFPPSPANGALEDALCGNGGRWETIGIYFASLAVFFASDSSIASNADGYVHEQAQRTAMGCKAWYISLQCEALCQRLGQVNDLTVWLLTAAANLCPWCFGDDSYNSIRVLSALSAVIYALGFHKGSGGDFTTPRYIIELRRRALALTYELDKSYATLVGRPPLLSRHYMMVEPPLDLPNEAIMGSTENLEAAMARLDADGWSTDGKLNTAVRARVMSKLIIYREEALELATSNDTGNLQQRALQILSDLKSTWQSLPIHLRYDMYDSREREQLPPSNLAMHSFHRLEYLYTEFLIYKRLVSDHENYRYNSIQISHEIVGLILSMVKRRAALIFYRSDSEWAMVGFALPCASVLLLELFRQNRQPQSQPLLSRSTIVKDLSGVILCCDWLIESGHGNHDTIKQAQSIFSRGLDQVLDNAVDPRTESAIMPSSTAESVDIDFANFPVQEEEWNSWLESFGLQADAWVDFTDDAAVDLDMVGV